MKANIINFLKFLKIVKIYKMFTQIVPKFFNLILFLLILTLKAQSAKIIIDDFNNNSKYNSAHTNSIGGYTDEDGTLYSDSVISNRFLRLVRNKSNTTNAYWYSGLKGLNVSQFNYLLIKLRKSSDENFFIQLQDVSNKKYQLAINYFSPISIDSNNFGTYLIPLNYFKYVDIKSLKDFVINFNLPSCSISTLITNDIDEISFISTNFIYSPVINSFLITDFENKHFYTKQGGYFAVESDSNSFARPAYSNSISSLENNTPCGKFSFEWLYNLCNNDYSYSACYFNIAPEGFYSDISGYNTFSFYVKSLKPNPYYKFQLKDRWGRRAERVFKAEPFWKKIEFNIYEMASQANLDLKNISSFIFLIKYPGLADKLYIDDLYLENKTYENLNLTEKNNFIDCSFDKNYLLSNDDYISINFVVLQDCSMNISLYTTDGSKIENLIEKKLLKNTNFEERLYFNNYKNGIYILRVETYNEKGKQILNKQILIAR